MGVGGVGGSGIPLIFPPGKSAVYIQICGVNDKNKAFVEELENKISNKLNEVQSIKFLTPKQGYMDYINNKMK